MALAKQSRVVGVWSDAPSSEHAAQGIDESGLRVRPEPELARGPDSEAAERSPGSRGEDTAEVLLDELREVDPSPRPSVPPPLPASLELPTPDDEASTAPTSPAERVDFDELARRTAVPPPPAWRLHLRWLWRVVGLPAAGAALAGILLAAAIVTWAAPRLFHVEGAQPEIDPVHVVRLPLIRLGPGPIEEQPAHDEVSSESDMVFDLEEAGAAE